MNAASNIDFDHWTHGRFGGVFGKGGLPCFHSLGCDLTALALLVAFDIFGRGRVNSSHRMMQIPWEGNRLRSIQLDQQNHQF
jgi:hypothetical protein